MKMKNFICIVLTILPLSAIAGSYGNYNEPEVKNVQKDRLINRYSDPASISRIMLDAFDDFRRDYMHNDEKIRNSIAAGFVVDHIDFALDSNDMCVITFFPKKGSAFQPLRFVASIMNGESEDSGELDKYCQHPTQK